MSEVNEEITLDSLKNNDNKPLELEIEEINDEEETHLSYKKKLNKKVSEFTSEEKAQYNKLAQKKVRKEKKNRRRN